MRNLSKVSIALQKLRFNTENKYNSIRQREGKKSKEIIQIMSLCNTHLNGS